MSNLFLDKTRVIVYVEELTMNRSLQVLVQGARTSMCSVFW